MNGKPVAPYLAGYSLKRKVKWPDVSEAKHDRITRNHRLLVMVRFESRNGERADKFLSGCEALAGCRDAILTGVFGSCRDGGTPKTHPVP